MNELKDYEYSVERTYLENSEYLVLERYLGEEKHLIVPSLIDGMKVKGIGKLKFRIYGFIGDEVESVTFSEGIETIFDFAFYGKKNLKEVHLPKTLNCICEKAFADCSSLEKITFKSPELILGPSVFLNDKKLFDKQGFFILNNMLLSYKGQETEVTIPNGVRKICDYAFYKNKTVTSVCVTNSVVKIGESVFDGCVNLTQINLPDKIKYLDRRVFALCKSLESIVLSDKLEFISFGAFRGCEKLNNIEWGSSLIEIEEEAFFKCNSLEVIHFPEKLSSIEKSAFNSCENLKEITLPKSIDCIDEKAFTNCDNLETINILSDKYFTCMPGSFSYSPKMRENFINKGIELTDTVFYNLKSADLEKYYLDNFAYWENVSQRKKELILEDWNRKISIKYPKGKNYMRNLVFLKSTTKELNTYFNEGCHLELIEIEFYLEYFTKNNEIEKTAVLLEYKNNTFSKDLLEEYQNHKDMLEIGFVNPTITELREKWVVRVKKEFLTISGYRGKNKTEILPIAIDTGVPILCVGGGKYGCLEELVLPNDIIALNEKAFLDSKLKKITLPSQITEIPRFAFNNCKNLEEINLHDNIKYIGVNSFYNCVKLVEINFPDSLEVIDRGAFNCCDGLVEITLPKNLTYVGEYAFGFCDYLKRVILENIDTEIDVKAFAESKYLEFVGTVDGENLLEKFIITN